MIKRHTAMTSLEANNRLEDRLDNPVSGHARILLREYTECLLRVEIQQKQDKPNLLNPSSANQSDDWKRVHQLVEDISFNRIDPRLRNKLAELEQQLKAEGVL